MHTRLLTRLRHDWPLAIAFLALIISLGGTSFAAGVLLPPGSVGTARLRPGVVTRSRLAANAISSDKAARQSALVGPYSGVASGTGVTAHGEA